MPRSKIFRFTYRHLPWFQTPRCERVSLALKPGIIIRFSKAKEVARSLACLASACLFASYAARTSDAPRVMHTRHTLLRSRHRAARLSGRENLVRAARSPERVGRQSVATSVANRPRHARHKLWLITGDGKIVSLLQTFLWWWPHAFTVRNAWECRWAEEIGRTAALYLCCFISQRKSRLEVLRFFFSWWKMAKVTVNFVHLGTGNFSLSRVKFFKYLSCLFNVLFLKRHYTIIHMSCFVTDCRLPFVI
jgi:hypothetical protein